MSGKRSRRARPAACDGSEAYNVDGAVAAPRRIRTAKTRDLYIRGGSFERELGWCLKGWIIPRLKNLSFA
jgi:hypothetical protein